MKIEYLKCNKCKKEFDKGDKIYYVFTRKVLFKHPLLELTPEANISKGICENCAKVQTII